MSKITISKELNLTQLISELQDATGESNIGLRSSSNGVTGYVQTVGPIVTQAVLQATVDAHIAGPSIPLVAPPDPREEARERYLAAVAANKDTAPWGRILYDKAIADGLIEA